MRPFEIRVGVGGGHGRFVPQGTGGHTYQRSGAGDGLEEHLAGLRGGRPWAGGAESPRKESRRRGDGAEGVGGVRTARRPGGPAAAWGFETTPEASRDARLRLECGWGGIGSLLPVSHYETWL